jgi:hypothetical protein
MEAAVERGLTQGAESGHPWKPMIRAAVRRFSSISSWAGSIGRIAGEQLPAIALIGAAFIVAGFLVRERTPQSRRNRHIATTPTFR